MKSDVLRELKFGERVAELEIDLASYFVETEQWRKLSNNEVDVIFGPKGAGKSAIYSTLLQREEEFWDKDILLISAEKPRGTAVFSALVNDPPTSEVEFVALWKLYILSLLGATISEYDFRDEDSKAVVKALVDADLLPARNAELATRLKRVVDYVRKRLRVEAELKIDPLTGAPTAYVGRISLSEPNSEDDRRGFRSVDQLLASADRAFESNGCSAWVLFDRLDVAFAESSELEANALRGLFKCYLDMADLDRLVLKIFLRSDIWTAITEAGFREASHVTRQMDIQWSESSLLNLVVRRLLQNDSLTAYYQIDPERILGDVYAQRDYFDRLVPDQVEAGKARKTFEWILSRVQDGTANVAPRELIHFLTEAKDEQLAMIERGEGEAPDEELISANAIRSALPTVSRVRLEQTLYAEHPELKWHVMELEGEKTDQTPTTLSQIWRTDASDAEEYALKLIDVGFFERRGTKEFPRYWVPFLYRPGLSMVQGSAAE